MGKMKIGNPAPKISFVQQAQETMNNHSDLFKRLAELEAKESQLVVETVVEKQDIHHTKIIHNTELISKPDHRARKYAKELSDRAHQKIDVAVEMIDDRLKHATIRHSQVVDGMKLISSSCEISKQKISELTKSVEELKARKPEEKQIVIEKPVQSKLMLLGLGISLALNILILIIK
jgi:hypothetical protein